ncbi:MAG: hypothetical protein AAGF26_04640 [Cyanobacteria bacterium P01_G01_bin.49]
MIFFSFSSQPETLIRENQIQNLHPVAIVNIEPLKKNYAGTAQFWGRLATGVKQPSAVTLYPNQQNRLSIVMLLPDNCGRIFEINHTKITQVTYTCPQQEKDESTEYVDWKVIHNVLAQEVKMIAPGTNSPHPLYVRQQAFWIITY